MLILQSLWSGPHGWTPRDAALAGDTHHPVLAQTGSSQGEVLLWVGVLLAATIAGSIVVLFIRSRFLSRDTGDQPDGTLFEQLRQMRDRGDMTPDEFERARARIIQRTTGKPAESASNPQRPSPGPDAHDSGDETPNDPPPTPLAPPSNAPRTARPGFDLTGAPLPAQPTPAENAQRGPSDSPTDSGDTQE
ncbi:MAG: SHOCT domain-containing protein [Planctomycetota bacterium]